MDQKIEIDNTNEKGIIEEQESIENIIENEIEEQIQEESIENSLKEHLLKNKQKIIKEVIIVIFILTIIYFGMVKYFTDHFYFGTQINGVYVSGRNIGQVKKIMKSELENYTLVLKQKGNKTEQIKGQDIGLKYSFQEKIQELKEKQNPFRWPLVFFTRENSNLSMTYSYDKRLLKEQFHQLSCLNNKNEIQPKNPTFKYINNGYVIVGEVPGNKVDKKMLYFKIEKAIRNTKPEIDLELEECYEKPKYYANSPKTIKVRDTLNKYLSSNITYTFTDEKEIIDSSIIHNWLIVDENLKITIDENKVREYIDTLCKKYNTVGRARNFRTSSGKIIKIEGGDYGWAIDKEKEIKNILSYIKRGRRIIKQPEYKQKALIWGNNDIGDTYVEIDLNHQHMWFYKNGDLVTQGDVVTGNIRKNHSTPKGIYELKSKSRNVVLRGPGYAAPVSFWMPFNGGIGIHDANWRKSFGGTIYKANGSHGCINSPYCVAKAIFDHIEPGTPVICY
ncbi:L,D-transpeptidase family protein [Garciella nitratireducens]|uniref:Peptidoglycan transpeptidase, ErfK-YbiS-YhnG family n=2 Tax=Garciella TaxID=218204 RepID=A0A1T4N241_9FIRM|nr:peptidoglycan binding domain-containing protein [Garciella nitratireducens]SJZ73174.1 peptidoglycan transpeptidase precursor, ErfK-YbiS-YhnG family [Garciella nitratireducens DSM 15102]